jgi:ubiquinone/menaquinone biosynthesis C-methylase UbiE
MLFLLPMLVSAESVMKEGYRNDYLPQGITPRHEMDKAENWIAIFEHERRDEWQEPEKVIENMKLKEGDVVADIGAGSGYFTRRLAAAVGPTGKAFGVDIEPELVKYMAEDARKLNLNNYIPKLATMADSGLEPNSVDVVFICTTYHHIEDRINYMRKLKKVLKEKGRIIFVEFYKKKMDFGPPTSHKDSEETIIGEMKEASYRLTRTLQFLRYQYFLEFEPNVN